MNKPQIITENGKPKFVVLEYENYLEMLEEIDDREALNELLKSKENNEEYISFEDLKKELR